MMPELPKGAAASLSAPGRAMQQLGSAIGSLGSAFQDETNKQDEFNANLALLNWENKQTAGQMEAHANFTRENPDGWALEQHGARTQSFNSDVLAKMPNQKMQQKAQLYFAQRGHNFYEQDQRFEYGKRNDMIYGNTSAAITGEFAKPSLNNPDTIVDDVQGSLAGVGAIIKSAPISEERKRALESEAAALALEKIKSVYIAADREGEIDVAAKQLMERLPRIAPAVPGPQSQAPAVQPRTTGFIPKTVVFHDYGGSPKNSDGMHNPYNALVFPDGTVRYRNPSDPYGVKAPHAYKMNNTSVGIAYAGPVGSKPTPEALATLQKEYDTVRQMFPGISYLGHGEAYQKTKGTAEQASKDGRDLIEASWRAQIRNAEAAPQAPSGPVPMAQRGLTQYAGLAPPGNLAGSQGLAPKLTAYAPQGGGPLAKMEGGYAAAKPGPDGKAEVRTLEDFASGKSKYITIAGDPSQYGKSYTIPRIEWIDSKGNKQVSENVKAVVHDTGSAFKGKGDTRFDVPVAKDLTNEQMNAQPFLKGGVQFIPDGGAAPSGGPDKQKVVLAGLDPKQKAAKLEELVSQGYQSVTHQVDKDGNDVLIAHRADKPAWYINSRGKGDGKSELDRPEFAGPEWAGESIKKIRTGDVRPMNTIAGGEKPPMGQGQVADASGRVIPAQAGPQSQLQELLLRQMPALEKRAALARDKWAQGVGGQVKQIMDLAEKGYAKDADLDTIEKVLAQKPDVAAQYGLTDAIQGARAFVNESREFRLLTPPEQKEIVDLVRNGVQGIADPAIRAAAVKRAERMERLVGETSKAVKEDLLEWGDRIGLHQTEKLDWNNPESISRRADQARAIAQRYGVDPQFFTKAERDALKDEFKKGGKPMLGLLGAMHDAFGSDMIYAMKDVSDNAPVAANVGWMLQSGHGMKTIEDAARGMEIMSRRASGEKITAAPKPADLRKTFFDTVGATTFSRVGEKSVSSVLDTATAIYEARALDNGWAEAKPDEFGKIFKEVIGESTDKQGNTFGGFVDMGGGHKAIAPPNVKNESGWFGGGTFRQLLDAVRQEDLIDAFGSMPMSEKNTPLSMAKVRSGKLVTVGDGRYFIATGDLANDPQFIKDGTGRNYVLDLKALEPKLRTRRPDLYKGYENPGYTPAETTMPQQLSADMGQADALLAGVGAAGPQNYQPGPVESDMIIDERPSSVLTGQGQRNTPTVTAREKQPIPAELQGLMPRDGDQARGMNQIPQ